MQLPIEIFLSFIAFAVIMGIVGLWKRIPLMMFIAGSIIVFWAITTDTIIMESFLDGAGGTITSYDVTSRTGQDDVRTGNSEIYAEFASSSSSQLVGDQINCLTLHIKKSGSPDTNTLVRYGVWDNAVTPNLKYTFGTMNITAVPTTVQPVKLCNLASVYTIVTFDRIGIAWNDGDVTNRVTLDLDTTNPFDGTTTFIARWNGASWVSATGTDYQGKMSLEQISDPIVYDTFEFTEYPKILFGVIASIFMLAGALIWKYEES